MKIINEVQGSSGWLDARRKYNTASEASTVMGFGYGTRGELLRMKATGAEQEFSKWTLEVLFAKGHEVEALARPLAEELIGEELFPVTGVCLETGLLASFDGLTMDESVAWECKQWNETKAASVRSGRVPTSDYWQVVQQLIVSGAFYCLYMVTDGTAENTVSMKVWNSSPGEAKATSARGSSTTIGDDGAHLVASWVQFNSELAAYVPVVVAPDPVGKSPDQLPALLVEVTGMVTHSNLAEFRDHAAVVFAAISTELQTDTDFADAEKTVKWCKDVEGRLDRVKEHALAQTASIDELFRTIDSIKAEARSKRLELDRAVKTRKENLRVEIIDAAYDRLASCLDVLNESLNGVFPAVFELPVIPVDFAGVMKGKKTVTSLNDAVDAELARAKVVAAQSSVDMMRNISLLALHAKGFETLFRDAPALVVCSDPESLVALIAARISQGGSRIRHRADPGPLRRKDGSNPAPVERPTAEVIVSVVAGYFDVSDNVALGWLMDISTQEVA